jgi:Holliday junction resolvasome RuvABC endonuclease subunit
MIMTTKRKTSKLFIVGIDPSLTATGLTLDRHTSATLKNKLAEGDDRLRLVHAMVTAHCMGADMAVIEDLPVNAKSAGLTGMSQGAVRMALRDLNIPYVKIPPATLKKAATGDGKAGKPDLRKALDDFQAAGDVALNLKDDNQVDAFWLREIGLTLLGEGSLLADPTAVDRYVDTPPVREVQHRIGS